MKKVILFGTYTSCEYHPLQGVDDEIKAILGADFEIMATEDMEIFHPDTLSSQDLLILYGDRWNEPVAPQYMGALIAYVAMGGKLLVIHNGISFQDNFEFMQMVGGKFDHHPEIRHLSIQPVGEYTFTEGVTCFEVFDEPYQFEFCQHTPKNIFLQYEMDGVNYPAGWKVDFCLGKAVYLMPGHTADVFRNEAYRQLIFQTANWLI